jgi:hypothetical protein
MEVLLALAISAILLAAIGGIFFSAARLRERTTAMLDAATMAISDSYLTVPSDQIHSQIILMPKDTGQTPADTKANAAQVFCFRFIGSKDF